MKNSWYRMIRFLAGLGLFLYFKKIKAYGVENIPKNTAVMFVSNHRNGLIDPMLIAITNPTIHHFLTRASAFKNPIANFLLRSINMLPIYRIRDGKGTLQKNQDIFEVCYKAFEERESVLIFPEGTQVLPRRLQALSKGFTRIAFGYLDNFSDAELYIQPVGMNYSNMQVAGSSVAIYYGKPIIVGDYHNQKDEKQAIEILKQKVATSLQQLSTHIEDLENHDTIERYLISKGIDFLDPVKANQLIADTTNWEVSFEFEKPKKQLIYRLLYRLFRLNTFFPILIWKSLKNKIKEQIFISTFRYGVGMASIPLFYLLQGCLVGFFTNFFGGAVYFFVSILLLYFYKNTCYTDKFITKPS